MGSYEECRGPPQLFFLDKFDVAGAGACLKRYTDPSFYTVETASSGMTNLVVQRDKKTRKKRGSRRRNGEVPEVILPSRAKLHELLSEERVQNRNNDPAYHVKLKRRQSTGSPFDPKTKRSYMEKFLENPSKEQKSNFVNSVGVSSLDQTSNNTCDSVQEIVEISTVTSTEEQLWRKKITLSSPNRQETESNKPYMEELSEEAANEEILNMPEPNIEYAVNEISFSNRKVVENKGFFDLGAIKKEDSINNYHSEDVTCEVANYADGFQSMDSDMETDSYYRPNNNRVEKKGSDSDTYDEAPEHQYQFSGSQSTESSSTYGINSKKGSYSHSQSDTFSSPAENMLSDGDGEADLLFSSDYAAEIVCMSSEEISVNGDIAGAKSHELAEDHPTGIEVLKIPTYRSDSGKASRNPLQVKLVAGDNLQISSQISIIPFEANEFPLSQVSADIHPVGELVNVNDTSDVIHDTMLHTQDVPDLLQKVEDKMPLSECASDSSTRNLGSEANSFSSPPDEWSQGLPRLEICSKLELESGRIFKGHPGSPTGENMEIITSVLDDKVNTNPVAGLCSENLTLVVDHEIDDTSESGVNAENFAKEVHSLKLCYFSGSHLSDIKVVSPLKDDSEFDFQRSGAQMNFGRNFSSVDDWENGESIKDIDRLGNYESSVEFAPDYSRNSIDEEHVKIANISAETVQGKAAVVAGATYSASARGDIDNDVCPSSDLFFSPSRNCRDIRYTSISRKSFKDLKIEVPLAVTSLTESEAQKEARQQATGPTYLSIISSNAAHNDHPNSELINYTSHILLRDGMQGVHPDVITPQSSSKQVEQGLEISPTHRKRHIVDSNEYPMYLATHHLPMQKQPNSMSLNDQGPSIHPLNHLEKEICSDFPSESYLEDISVQLSTGQIMQELADQKPEKSEQPSDPIESIFSGFDQFPETHPVNLGDTTLLPLPPKPWTTGKLQEIAKPLEKDSTNHGMNSSPRFVLSTVADENAQFGFVDRKTTEHQSPFVQPSTEEGKRLQSGNVSGCSWTAGNFEEIAKPLVKDSTNHEMNSSPWLVPSKMADENAQFGFADRKTTEHQSPFVQPSTEEGEMLQSGNVSRCSCSTGKLQEIVKTLEKDSTNHEMNSSPCLVPSTMDDENGQFDFVDRETTEHQSPFVQPSTEEGEKQIENKWASGSSSVDFQHDFLTSERTPPPNPYFELPPICNEIHDLGSSDADREIVQNLDTFPTARLIDGITHEQRAIQNLNQLERQSSLDNEQHQQNFETLVGDMGNTTEASVVSMTRAEKLSRSENEKPLINIPRIQDPLIEEETSLENYRQQRSFQSSKGDVVNTHKGIMLPMTESETRAAEDEIPNGKPSTLLPRPRAPLIEAVAAHDRSKMKKVVASTRPQVVQKVNLREVVLDQIRNKSFNLRPAAPKARPSFRGPRSTNLKVAAILEKVNAIRQVVGSDDDDDDSWSDS